MQIEAGSIPAGAVAIIVIAAIAIGIGFMTLICSLVSVAKNHRRAARLQVSQIPFLWLHYTFLFTQFNIKNVLR